MSVYAPTPAYAERQVRPGTLTLIVGGHALLLAGVMTVRMDLPIPFVDPPTVVQTIPIPEPPAVNPPEPQPEPQRQDSRIDRVPAVVPMPQPAPMPFDPPALPTPPGDPPAGNGVDRPLNAGPGPAPVVRAGPRFATPPGAVEPPYPDSKRQRDEEASLRLRLTIDFRGRVTAVEPVGAADPVFLAAARRHILARWRYRPATEDGRAVASSTIITLRFELDD